MTPTPDVGPVHGLNAYSLAIFLHIVLFVYWLGSDVGVYYSSRYVLRADLTPAARSVAAKIMHVVDMAPRVCLVLFLPSGVTLMALSPFGEGYFPGWLVALAWVGALCWLALVVYDYTRGATPLGRVVQRLDLLVRYAMVAVLVVIGLYMIVAAEPFGVQTNPKWLGGKLTVYGVCVLGGVLIRWRLSPFGPAFGRLMTEGSSPEVEREITRSVRSCLPYVYLIWVMVLTAAFLGVVKPGTTAFG
ncbi:hypothetical protein Ssi03_40970 [Sphaerisporangium siamense]|uniref:DUF2269 family protein n=1 Tax=Sphaerisporangium siamense TaxID=795645 RepID=A0A7W7DEX8_9ACTN|nr:hypothetical protein [Sphaerisporangium siamense]MBB4704496.1 hypothetical protein [Sphaerisporangium siamense]GII86107.1 hypothetical protein Ssi03_40970 [Sphaerisporangium siamense]